VDSSADASGMYHLERPFRLPKMGNHKVKKVCKGKKTSFCSTLQLHHNAHKLVIDDIIFVMLWPLFAPESQLQHVDIPPRNFCSQVL
jgi:hypothetical protein